MAECRPRRTKGAKGYPRVAVGRPASGGVEDMHYVYILLSSKDNRFYIGSTDNLKIRYSQHSKGQVPATKHRLPLKLIYYEAFVEKLDAIQEEKFLKTGKGRERLKYLFQNIKN